MRAILEMEYGHLRAQTNSIAMQAVATRHGSQTSSSHSRNEDFITQIIDGSRSVLHVVVDLLGPTNCLTYIPVRSYYRILAAVVYLIKVCEHPSTLFIPVLSGITLAIFDSSLNSSRLFD